MAHRNDHVARSGAIVAAVWLIGLGVVFLVQQTLDWSWGQAWPLFVILAGVAGIISVLITARPVASWMVALTWPVAFTVVGVILLLSTTGTLGTDLGSIVRWWPVALIVLGAWYLIVAFMPRAVAGSSQLTIPLEGAASASVRLQFGGGEVSVEPGPADQLLVGQFENGAAVQRRRGPGSVELSPDGSSFPWFDRPLQLEGRRDDRRAAGSRPAMRRREGAGRPHRGDAEPPQDPDRGERHARPASDGPRASPRSRPRAGPPRSPSRCPPAWPRGSRA